MGLLFVILDKLVVFRISTGGGARGGLCFYGR